MLSQAELIAGLREYISQDTFIPNFFKRLEEGENPQDALCLMQLEAAIKSGDLNNEIFSNQHCSLYLLFLIEKEKIPFWAGINAYYYCMALMQFTDKQPLHTNDQDVKLYQDVFAVPFMKDGQVTPEGKQYLQAIEKRYATELPGLKFRPQNILIGAETFAPMDQCLICISPDGFNDIDHPLRAVFNKTKKSIVKETLYLADNLPINREGQTLSCLVIPSFALINEFNNINSMRVMTFKPMMGLLGRQALETLHREKDAHPFTLYSPFMSGQGEAENVTAVQGEPCGPFLASLRDVSYVAKANFFTWNERRFLTNDVVSVLKFYCEEERILEGLKNRELFLERMDQIIGQLTDHGYSSVAELLDREKTSWLTFHVIASLRRCKAVGPQGEAVDGFNYGLYADIHRHANTAVWNLVDDDVLYFIGCIANRNEGIWRNLYDMNRDVATDPKHYRNRPDRVLNEIAVAIEMHKPKCVRRLDFEFSGRLFSSPSKGENDRTPTKKQPKSEPKKPNNPFSVGNFRS